MASEKKVSVLLSIYNVEKYLEECLDSILAQSYKNLEIVCVDNGSPDNCAAILEEYAKKDNRIKIVTVKENNKLCGGRNAGLDNATGDYIMHVDPDDWIEVDHIKAMVDTIETLHDSNGNEYNLVVNANFTNYSENEKTKEKTILYSPDFEAKEYTLADYNTHVHYEIAIPMWGRLYRKSFLDKYNVRYLDGFQFDNIPYTTKLFAHMGVFYTISKESHPNSAYWRRLEANPEALTDTVLYKNLEMPACLENLYDYLKEHNKENKVKVMYLLFFRLCFHCHIDKARYYFAFRNLMLKMENTIKSNPSVYNQEDIYLCDLLLYSNGYFDFCTRYFASPVGQGRHTVRVKLFNFLQIYKKKQNGSNIKYYACGIPVLKRRTSNNKEAFYLFGFIPLFKIINS